MMSANAGTDRPSEETDVSRPVTAPLKANWSIVDGLPLFHRTGPVASGRPLVHVHGFGVSGSYLEPTAARLASRYPTYVPDLPGSGRSHRPAQPLDIPGLAGTVIAYLDAIGIERASFVGNSLGCVVLVEVAAAWPDRVDRIVLVSPAGGVNNQPLPRALRQMVTDSVREPPSLWPVAAADYLRFGVTRSWRLFADMVAYPTLERLELLHAPTLVIGGDRDPLVDFGRASVFSGLPHVDVVRVHGAHALNYSRPDVVSALIDAHLTGGSLAGPSVEVIDVPSR